MATALDDSSGRGYSLTNQNGVLFGMGKFGICADFGTGIANKGLTNNTNLMSALKTPDHYFSLWIKMNAETGGLTNRFFDYSSVVSVGQQSILQYEYNAGNRRLQFYVNLSTTNITTFYNITLGTTNWYNIVCVKRGTTTGDIYVNGKLVATSTGVGT